MNEDLRERKLFVCKDGAIFFHARGTPLENLLRTYGSDVSGGYLTLEAGGNSAVVWPVDGLPLPPILECQSLLRSHCGNAEITLFPCQDDLDAADHVLQTARQRLDEII